MEDERILKALLSATQPIDSSFKQGQDLRLEVDRKMLTAIGELDCPPIADDLPRVVATVQTAAAVLNAVGGEE